ncbi:uncharacterized protein LOC107478697 [Arachis duranensis]|uniref:Uncharacterized protein LOC107478697 n=1 Tax=Arachis duranensis TaxID=130453 RepID=A0A6P4CN56_ARADU|nr:uncharacterized protein LOC107478697 [Arachis duranensis]XP_025675973.1 uncharacterized protein LOC112776155 [Arachis hypogaea]
MAQNIISEITEEVRVLSQKYDKWFVVTGGVSKLYLDVVSKGEEGGWSAIVIAMQVKNDYVQQVKEGDNIETDVAAENEQDETNSDNDSDDEEFIPSDLEVDSADDVHFTNSEEEYDDASGFEELTSAKDSERVDKGKRVMNGDFSDEEGFNSDEVDLEYEVGGDSDDEDGQGEDNYEAIAIQFIRMLKT